MSSPAVRLLASRLARSPSYSPNNTGLFKVGPQGPRGGYRPPPPSLGGPVQEQPGGWNDPLGKEPVFRSPGVGGKGGPSRPGGGYVHQPYRFPRPGGGYVNQPYRPPRPGSGYTNQPYRF